MNKKLKQEEKHHHHEEEEQEQELIPGLPDHLAQIPLSLLKTPALLFSVCHSWRRLLYSSTYPPFLSLYALLSSTTSSSVLHFSSFDPISSTWHSLPPPPLPPHRPLLLRHPSFIARNLPIQSVAINNRLVLLSATTHHLLPALSHPLIFDPSSRKWLFGPKFSAPRRWCATASVGGSVFLASGSGSEYNQVVARSAEKWVLKSSPGIEFGSESKFFGSESGLNVPLPSTRLHKATAVKKTNKKARLVNSDQLELGYNPVDKWVFGPDSIFENRVGRISIGSEIEENGSEHEPGSETGWEKVEPMRNGRFSREAVEGVGWRGKVCMVNSMKEGEIYDMERNVWEEMPEGMLNGWNGPAASMDENEIYVVDEEKGVLSRYIAEKDLWEEVVECGPMKGALKMAAGGGRVCVVCGSAGGVVVVDVTTRPVRMWVVEAPRDMKVVGVHILPRMGREDI